MIVTQKQYKITLARIDEIDSDLVHFDEIALAGQGIDPIIINAQRRSLESERDRLKRDASRYTALREGRVGELRSDDIGGLGLALVEARLAMGLTQKKLASRLNIKEQQVQRYEQDRYQSASLARIQEVTRALETDTSVEIRLAQNSNSKADIFDIKRLPVREMKKRGWLDEVKLPKTAVRSDLALAEQFMQSASTKSAASALHKQRVRLGGKVNPYAVAAWKARVLQIAARDNRLSKTYQGIDALFLRQLVSLSAEPKGPVLALEALRKIGIAVVVESHLPGTHLDGAAMLLGNKTPVIGLTLRHDRLDNFWFVLFHELAHVVCHRENGLAEGFFDDQSATSLDALEIEADEFALNALISDEIWKNSFVRFTRSEDQVVAFANKLGIGPAIVAGRIRHERKDYTLFNGLVGGKEVRALFQEQAG